MSNPRTTASSVREQKLARVIDREVAPIWHDRFARLLLRDLPNDPELFTLDVHSGPGHTTAELLQRLDESSRIVALGRDPWLMQVSKTRVRPEWKRRVYFKSGDIDDVTNMNDDTYDLSVANLVLGEQVVDWQPALAELMRVTKPGGQVLVTLPLAGTWQEVEDLFEELLRDEGMRKEVATLQKLRRRRPKPSQLNTGAHNVGLGDMDFVIEHERFELLFRSGREFLFAPVIEHGPLRLWKAILGQAEKPQALFWRFKEAIDTYYLGRVLSVTVVAGLLRVRVPGESGNGSYASPYWSRYPSLSRLWGISAVKSEPSVEEFDFDLDIDLDEAIDAIAPGASKPHPAAAPASDPHDDPHDDETSDLELDLEVGGFGRGFDDVEVSGANELPAIEDVTLGDQDPFGGLLDELDAEAAARAEVAAEDAKVEAAVQPRARIPSGRNATLGALGDEGSAITRLPRKPGESGSSPIPSRLPRKPGESGVSPIPSRLPPKPGESGVSPIPAKLPRSPGESQTGPIPKLGKGGKLSDRLPARKPGDSQTGPIPKLGQGGKLSDRLPARAPTGSRPPLPPPPPVREDSAVGPPPKVSAKPSAAVLARLEGRTPPKPPLPSPPPAVTKPGEDDPFASMLADDDEDLEEFEDLDAIEELAGDSLVPGEFEDDDDLADSFGKIEPELTSSRRPAPPKPPPPKKK